MTWSGQSSLRRRGCSYQAATWKTDIQNRGSSKYEDPRMGVVCLSYSSNFKNSRMAAEEEAKRRGEGSEIPRSEGAGLHSPCVNLGF